MGSDCHVIVHGRSSLADEARAEIDDLEQKWSRFIPDSEVSRLNRLGRLEVSTETVLLVRRAQQAWRLSGGAFDPTVLGAVLRAGYTTSFERLDGAAGHTTLGLGAADITIDATTVELPPGVGFDPGGIGKGLAADLVAASVMEAGADGVCINLGGDLRAAGDGPWTVAVEHPLCDTPLTMVGLRHGAVATSTTLRRRWKIDGVVRHHLIDPRTGWPSDSDLQLATVIAGDGWIAEALAKAVLLGGSDHPFDILGGTGAEGLAVDVHGQVTTSAGFGAYTGGVAVPDLPVVEQAVGGG